MVQELYKAKQEEKAIIFLNILVGVLCDIAKINNCENDIMEKIRIAQEKTIKSYFYLEKEMKKYTIFTNDGSLHVYRRLNEDGEMWYLRLYKEKNVVREYKLLPKPVYISQEPVFDKCVLENGVVKFYEKYGRILAEIDLNEG